MKSGIYILKNKINNKVYIGKSVNIIDRWYNHKSKAKNANKNSYISCAIHKYGWDNFEKSIIELIEDKSRLLDQEAYWIAYYDSTNKEKGYNILKYGTDNAGIKRSEEWKTKMLERMTGKNNPNYGKEMSQEQKEKISQSLKKTSKETQCWRNNKFSEKCRLANIQKLSKPIKQIDKKTKEIIKI